MIGVVMRVSRASSRPRHKQVLSRHIGFQPLSCGIFGRLSGTWSMCLKPFSDAALRDITTRRIKINSRMSVGGPAGIRT